MWATPELPSSFCVVLVGAPQVSVRRLLLLFVVQHTVRPLLFGKAAQSLIDSFFPYFVRCCSD